jgi:hypothetical protein
MVKQTDKASMEAAEREPRTLTQSYLRPAPTEFLIDLTAATVLAGHGMALQGYRRTPHPNWALALGGACLATIANKQASAPQSSWAFP